MGRPTAATPSHKHRAITRRSFVRRLAGSSAAGVFPLLLPSSILGRGADMPPNSRIGLGVIGTGGKGTGGMRNFMQCSGAQVVAVCDVSKPRREQAAQTAGLPPAAACNDFEELLARSDVDAVLIATPDHWHALIAIAAARAGKHVYCEKPLSNTVAEGRAVVEAVRRYGVVFQHGSQLRSYTGTRLACELVRNRRIGELRAVTIGSPPGRVSPYPPATPVPPGLDYDRWLGPAPKAPYCRERVTAPGWYFISDYSKAGWVAGYGVHDIDIANWGMGTEYTGPIAIEGQGVFPEDGLFDTVTAFQLEFTYANGLKLTMTDTGSNRHGVRFEGSEGWVFTRGGIEAEPKHLLRAGFGPNDVRLYASSLHEQNFVDCIHSGAQTITPEEVAHRATTTCLLGGIALRLGRRLEWNPEAEKFVGDDRANRLLSCAMRAPWSL